MEHPLLSEHVSMHACMSEARLSEQGLVWGRQHSKGNAADSGGVANLGDFFPGSSINFHVRVAGVSHFQQHQRTVPPSVLLSQGAADFHAGETPLSRAGETPPSHTCH